MQEGLEQPLERFASLVIHERQSKNNRLAETVAANKGGEMTEADTVPRENIKGDNITEVTIVDNHPGVSPENISHFILNIQLHSVVERGVGKRLSP